MGALSLIAACSAPMTPGVGSDPTVQEGDVVPGVPDTGDSAVPEMPVTDEDAGGLPTEGLSDWVFDDTIVHTIAIEISAESWAALEAAPYTWATATLTVDDVRLENIGLRLRGKIGAFRVISAKPKLKLSFGEFVDGQTLYGLEELSLNNNIVDCSYLKEMVGYDVFEAAGVPSLRTAYASVTVNDAPYGLYVMLESPDDEFLKRHYPDATGNLYDGKYVWYGGYSYTLLDFGYGLDTLYQLEEGADVGHADISGISNVVLAYGGTADWMKQSANLIDWEEYHRELAAEQWVGHLDGYALNTNNYRVYFDPEDGKAEILPWDMDYSLLEDYQWGMNWATPRGTLAANCFRDAQCLADHKAAMGELLENIAAAELPEQVERYVALSNELALADPRKECSTADIPGWQSYVRSWVATRSDTMRAWWGL